MDPLAEIIENKFEPYVPVILIGNLHPDVTKAELIEECSKYGTVLDVTIFLDPITKKSLGEAEVYYEAKSEADLAMAGLRNLEIRGQRIQLMIKRYTKDAFKPPRKDDAGL